MATLSEAQAAQALALTTAFKTAENRRAARMAALVALYYRQRVNVEDPSSIEAWLDIVVPLLIRESDSGARQAAQFFDTLRRIEAPGAPAYAATPALGFIDEGVRKSLLTVGPYAYTNKARDIRSIGPQREQALLAEAKQVTTKALAAATLRHTQAGSRQTVYDNAERDRVALGYVRVTRTDPCWFCAMLASRGLRYRAFTEGSFDASDARFSGDGDAKVHDNCGCSLKPVYADNDPLVARTERFADLWSEWGAGGGDAALRFRRGYEHLQGTGEMLTFEQANEGLRPA